MTGQTPDPFGPDRIPADPAPADTPPDDLIGRARHRADTAADLKARDIATTGHSWDGIQEYDNPLPRWWLWTFYACIVYAIGYSIAYPAWPMVTSATRCICSPAAIQSRASPLPQVLGFLLPGHQA